MKKHDLYRKIRNDKELQQYENLGFVRGEQRGKTMNVHMTTIVQSLRKQLYDLEQDYAKGNLGLLKKDIADVRNVAGCLWLKLKGEA